MNPIVSLITMAGTGSTENQFIQAVLQAGPFGKLILLVIFLFSVFSWAVIFHKQWQFTRMKNQNARFIEDFNQMGGDFGTLSQRAEQMRAGTLPAIFSESFRELRAISRIRDQQLIFDETHLSLVRNRMDRVAGQQIVLLEKWLIYLATTASVCPFLGLLGTVWGVLGTFMTMTNLESALTLKLIGPGISEALTTTIFGLGAAIPAVVGYNYFVNRVAVFRIEMEEFSLRLLAVLEKNILARTDAPQALTSVRARSEEPRLEIPDQVRFP